MSIFLITQEVGKNYFPNSDARLFKKAGHLDPKFRN